VSSFSIDFSAAASDAVNVNGASIPVAGALTTGHIVKVSGVAALTYGYLVNANVDAAAAIAGTKVDPAFGAQNASTTGTLASGTHTQTGGVIRKAIATQTTTYQALASDYDIPTDVTASSFTVTLLASPETGREYCIHDAVGLCGTPYRLTISGGAKSINGFGTSWVIATPFFSVTLRYNGTIWNVVGM
jgi:hypothetical protein